jgi:plasmid stability protein
MTNITLNQLDDQLTQRLQQRAHKNGRTLEAEITAILASVLTPPRSPISSNNPFKSFITILEGWLLAFSQ